MLAVLEGSRARLPQVSLVVSTTIFVIEGITDEQEEASGIHRGEQALAQAEQRAQGNDNAEHRHRQAPAPFQDIHNSGEAQGLLARWAAREAATSVRDLLGDQHDLGLGEIRCGHPRLDRGRF